MPNNYYERSLLFTDKTIKLFKANMAGSDGDNFVPQIKEPAGQKKKKPPKKVGP